MPTRRIFVLVALEVAALHIAINGVRVVAAYHALSDDAGSFASKLGTALVGSL